MNLKNENIANGIFISMYFFFVFKFALFSVDFQVGWFWRITISNFLGRVLMFCLYFVSIFLTHKVFQGLFYNKIN